MAFVPIERTARVSVHMDFNGTNCVSTFDVGDDSDAYYGAAGYFTGLAEDVWNNWRDQIMPHLSASVTLERVDVIDQEEADGEQATFSAAAVAGGEAGQSLPANVAYLVNKRTSRAGRNFRGRWWLPGVSEGIWPGGAQSALPTAFVDAFNADLDDFLEGLEDGSRGPGVEQRHMVVASRFDGTNPATGMPIPRDEGETSRVTSLTLGTIIGTRRTRIRR